MGAPNQSLAAMFQAMQGQGGGQAPPPPDPQQNPLAQMMNPQGGQAPPSPEQAPPGTPTIMQAPQAPPEPTKPPTKEEVLAAIAQQQAQLKQQYEQGQAQLQQSLAAMNKDTSQDIPDALKSFDKYNEDQYQKTYGGGGVLGTAGRALANLMSGWGKDNNGTIKDQMTQQNMQKYKEAVAAATQQMTAQKQAAAQAAQVQQAQLTNLNAQRTQLDEAQKHIEAQQNIGIKTDTLDNTKKKTDAEIRQKDEQLRIEALKLDKEANTPFAAIRDKVNDERKASGTPPLNAAELQNLNLQVKQAPASSSSQVYHWVDSEGNVHATDYQTTRTPQTTPNGIPELKGGAAPSTPAPTGTAPSATQPTITRPAISASGDKIIGTGKLPGTEQATRDFARSMEPKFQHVDDLINSLDKNGQMNYIASHWHEFMAGTLGHDPTYDQDYIRLKEAVGLVASGLSRVHNPRGASINLISKLEENMKVDRMDAPTLKAGLEEAQNWVHGYAHLGEKPVDLKKFEKPTPPLQKFMNGQQ